MLTRVFAGGSALVQGTLTRADLVVVGDRITAVGIGVGDRITASGVGVGVGAANADQVERIDCRGLVVAPGFIDLQCNGAVGLDITSQPDSIAAIASAIPRFGVTSWLPTVVTCPAARRLSAIDEIVALRAASPSAMQPIADPIGLHFEGPMISRDRLGAHDPRHVATPDATELDRWIASEVVALVTLAPEVPGALDVIRQLTAGGVVVSAGHTGMGPDDLAAARTAGLSYVTHLFNAMAPFNHRAPGPIGAALADPTIVAGIIADGLHVHPVAVRMAWQTLGPRRMSLVSDAVGALGLPYGPLRVGDFEIVSDETGVRTSRGVLAGSALALDQAVRNLMTWTGCTLADAVATVTSTPADLLGLTDRGRLAVGDRADLVVLDHDAQLVATIIAGRTAHGDL